MKVLAICATARAEGPSVRALHDALAVIAAAGHQTELALLPTMTVEFCDHCAACDDGEVCTIDDDVWPLYLKMKSADLIVLSTPVAFGSAMAMLKAVLERTGRIARLNGRQFADKRVALLLLEFSDDSDLTRQQLEAWCRLQGTRPPYHAVIKFEGKHSRESIEAGAAARAQAAADFGAALLKLLSD